MDPIIARVKSSVVKFRMFSPGQTVCVALSGGPDSTALLSILHKLGQTDGFKLKACHYDHGFRPGSEDDAKIAVDTATSLGVEIVTERNESGKPSGSLQEKARNMRYGYFERLLADGYADLIATGHTMDDSVETSIIWMLRGTGPSAFGGLPPVRDKYIRPLIDIRKDELLAWLNQNNIQYTTDPTNLSDDYLRNRIRHHIIPAMEVEAPKAVEAISRLARLVCAQSEVVDSVALDKLERFRTAAGEGVVSIDAKAVAKEPEALRFAIYRMALNVAGLDTTGLEICHIDAIDDLVTRNALGKSVDLPEGYTARVDHGGLTFCAKTKPGFSFEAPFLYPYESLVGDRKLIVKEEAKIKDAREAIDPGKMPENAMFRTRRPGDYLIPKNFKGRKKLKTFLIDRKTPSGARDFMPLLAIDSEVLWVPGLFLAPSIMADSKSQNIVTLRWDLP